MLTCKDFLSELSDFLDETLDAEMRAKLDLHMAQCPNCWVIADTTRNLTVALVFGLMAVSTGFIGTTFVQGALVDAVVLQALGQFGRNRQLESSCKSLLRILSRDIGQNPLQNC